MKIAILTGGGDSPGMNSFLRAVVRTAIFLKPETSVWGIYDGWKGAIENNLKKISRLDVAGISLTGGTILGTQRVPNLEKSKDLQESIALNLHDNHIDYLFVCGGNGSLAAANTVNNIIKEKGYKTKILIAPGSIDNDVCNNYGSSIGFYSALDKSLEMLDWIRDTASAHRRVYLIKSMGAASAYLAVYSGIAAGAEHMIQPGEDIDFEKMATMIEGRDRDTRIIVAEAYEKSILEIRSILEGIFKRRDIEREIRTVDMSYFQRGGKTAVTDILRASWVAYKMVKDAMFHNVDSGFYTAFYTGQPPTVLPLSEAVKADTSHSSIPEEIIELALALR
ncbi:MAG: 6-phosphofructokinase [Candidatus Kapabacteria bacterium]|nr:6-phosphofructokinase [Candidatus Kapabacteria bacterium]